MSILIADSGSTKTDWVLLDNNNIILQFQTIGFNPYFQSSDDIYTVLVPPLRFTVAPKPSIFTYKLDQVGSNHI